MHLMMDSIGAQEDLNFTRWPIAGFFVGIGFFTFFFLQKVLAPALGLGHTHNARVITVRHNSELVVVRKCTVSCFRSRYVLASRWLQSSLLDVARGLRPLASDCSLYEQPADGIIHWQTQARCCLQATIYDRHRRITATADHPLSSPRWLLPMLHRRWPLLVQTDGDAETGFGVGSKQDGSSAKACCQEGPAVCACGTPALVSCFSAP